MTSYLFPEHNDNQEDVKTPRVKGKIQKDLLAWMRSGKEITEELFFSEIGGKSVTAAFSNLKRRGYFKPDEAIVRVDGLDSKGQYTPAYRLAKIAIPEATPDVADSPAIVTSHEDIDEDVFIDNTPRVASIGVHVANNQPMLYITFEGDYKPLQHVMGEMEVSYLLANLEPFRRKRGE
jgi:hypothetical protein